MGADPQVRHRLALVVRTHLALGRTGDEEARVEASGRAHGRDPVREVVDGVTREREPFELAHLDEAHPTAVDVGTVTGEPPLHVGVVESHDHAVRSVREQQARLLEALAHGGDPVGEATGPDAEPGRRLSIGETGGDVVDVVVEAVLLVDRAAGEHVGAADEGALGVAPDHEHLGPDSAIAHEHDGGGQTQRDLVGTGGAHLSSSPGPWGRRAPGSSSQDSTSHTSTSLPPRVPPARNWL